jgi:hypothetical protein
MRFAVIGALALSCSGLSTPAFAGEIPAVEASASASLPANTPVIVALSGSLSSSANKVGDTFPLSVVQDVVKNGQVVIPRGTRAVGEVVWRTGKGGFGKSGKLEIAVRHIELGGQRLPVTGKFRQDGKGNTVGAVAGVAIAGLVGGFLIKGKAGVIPHGQEITVRTTSAFAFSVKGKTMSAPMALAMRAPLPAVAKRSTVVIKSAPIEEADDGDDDDDKPAIAPGFSVESADSGAGSDDGESSDDARVVRVAANNSTRYLTRGRDAMKDPAVKAKKESLYTVIKPPVSQVMR